MLAQIVLFDGFDPLDVVAPYEVLAAGGMFGGGALNAELVSAEGAREVPSGLGLLSLCATTALDANRADLIVVPGAAGQDSEVPAILARTLDTELPERLRESVADPMVTVATVCGGSLLLAMAGLINGRQATTHHMGLARLGQSGPVAIDARIVDDGDLISAAGVTSGLDLGLYLVERELGPGVALAVEKLIDHQRRGTVWRSVGASA
ncbi:MAG TPA: DJ-1/PfpI family protein [Pseudonocardiaceae bacterium]|jgi:transcriptional regulator GlxA family with amidase domain|nr:DJ-1/PfpI family protein [Pseudonocardiaceae bacterium]